MTPPGDSTEFLRQAVRDIFVALMLDGYDETDIRLMAEGEADSAISVYHRDYGSSRRDPDDAKRDARVHTASCQEKSAGAV